MDSSVFTELITAEKSMLEWVEYINTMSSNLIQVHFPVGSTFRDRSTGREYVVLAHEYSHRVGQIVAHCKLSCSNKGTPRQLPLKEILTHFSF